jgi:hypothetical protein
MANKTKDSGKSKKIATGKQALEEHRARIVELHKNTARRAKSILAITTSMAAAHEEAEEEERPPDDVIQAIREHMEIMEKMRPKAPYKLPLGSGYRLSSVASRDFSLSTDAQCNAENQIVSIGCDQATFDVYQQEGHCDAYEFSPSPAWPGAPETIERCKIAHGYAGSASLYPEDGATWYSHITFGFTSCYLVPWPGAEADIRIVSLPRVFLDWPDGWLEALSFGKDSYGKVSIKSYLDVCAAGDAYRDYQTVISGESPRGNYREGEIGVWNPRPQPVDIELSINFDVANPPSEQIPITIFEMIEIVAERFHALRRCNAFGECTVHYTPLTIEATKIC